jgi:hypothetical protein
MERLGERKVLKCGKTCLRGWSLSCMTFGKSIDE